MDNVTESRVIGKSTPRIEGALKVTGAALYTSDHDFPGLLYAWPVCATIANGKVTKLDTTTAREMPGVVAIYHRANIGPLFRVPPNVKVDERRPPLEDDTVRYYGQYIAVVVAKTVEQARAAAEKVHVTYRSETPNVSETLLETLAPSEKPTEDSKRGDVERALKSAAVTVDEIYRTPAETHNPIELHASVAVCDGQSFTLYETTQGIVNHRDVLAAMLGVPAEQVKVITKYLGSGFGGKLWPWPQAALAAACARNLGRPVKLVVTRQMMFHSAGHRPATEQRIQLGAEPSGKLVALQQQYANHTSLSDDYEEDCGEATPFMYSTPNLRVTSAITRRNVGTPTSMRGPGAVPGLFALESAMDELAIKLRMDPVKLRLMNEPSIDESQNIPFSSRHLKECLTEGAKQFGWDQRTPGIGSMQRDGQILGWGMAACSWVAMRAPTEVGLELRQDGTARIACAVQDIGTGTCTSLAQIVSHATAIPVDRIEVDIGDSSLPPGPVSGGSCATASVIPAVLEAAQNATKLLLQTAAKAPGSPFTGKSVDELEFADGAVRLKGKTSSAVPMGDILRAANVKTLPAHGKSGGTSGGSKPKVSLHSFGAQFAEIIWQPEIARLRVSRMVTIIDGGRIVNPGPARNQVLGSVVMGVGMALFEKTSYDSRSGRPVNDNLADYIVPVHADTPRIDVTFLDYPDYSLNPLGARGIGELGLAGVAAAITNAVYHATGVRVRELPVKIEDLLMPGGHARRTA